MIGGCRSTIPIIQWAFVFLLIYRNHFLEANNMSSTGQQFRKHICSDIFYMSRVTRYINVYI